MINGWHIQIKAHDVAWVIYSLYFLATRRSEWRVLHVTGFMVHAECAHFCTASSYQVLFASDRWQVQLLQLLSQVRHWVFAQIKARKERVALGLCWIFSAWVNFDVKLLSIAFYWYWHALISWRKTLKLQHDWLVAKQSFLNRYSTNLCVLYF